MRNRSLTLNWKYVYWKHETNDENFKLLQQKMTDKEILIKKKRDSDTQIFYKLASIREVVDSKAKLLEKHENIFDFIVDDISKFRSVCLGIKDVLDNAFK